MRLNPTRNFTVIDCALMFMFAYFTVDAFDELDELTNLLDYDSSEAEEPNKECSSVTEEPLPPISRANKSKTIKIVKEISIFERENNLNTEEKSEIHGGDTATSSDEDNRSADHQNYTDYGRSIKDLLKQQTSSDTCFDSAPSSSWKSKKFSSPASQPGKSESRAVVPVKTPLDIYSDPFFGIRIM